MSKTKKKSLMPVLAVSLYFIISFTVIVLFYQGIKLQYDKMLRDKVVCEKEVVNKGNLYKALMAEYDKYSSEERIAPFAIENLKMVKAGVRQVIVIDKAKSDKLKEIETQLNNRYE
ncbi:MAG: hypothetical protein Q8903_01895 [Bacteroidota bacterium]|nr:hypothetical protein [Bacteroidota bacterium]